MTLLDDIHHLTFLTADMDRLIDFYARVFEARVTFDMEEDGLRHAFIQVGPRTVLHPFQLPGGGPVPSPPMFQRGRLDHFALSAASESAFRTLRRRVMTEGASDGRVTDMGSLLILTFTDPDGGSVEIVWRKPGVPDADTRRRCDWTQVSMD